MAWKRPDSESAEPTSYSPPPSSAPAPATGRKERAVIGPSIAIQGDLSGEEDLSIHGRVQGTVDVKGNSVTIGETGRVKADVYAKTIIVEGEVEGNLFGGDQIILRSSGNVRGNLTAPRVALDDGAQFKGAIDMEPKRQAGAGRPGAGAARADERSPGAERSETPAAAVGAVAAGGSPGGATGAGAPSPGAEREAAGAARAGG
jgi:cytoskeletal protein CcmA (bactofilin family)